MHSTYIVCASLNLFFILTSFSFKYILLLNMICDFLLIFNFSYFELDGIKLNNLDIIYLHDA